MFWVVVAINNDFTQCIVNMYILASLTHEMLQKLCEQTKPIPAYNNNHGLKNQKCERKSTIHEIKGQNTPLLTLLYKGFHWQQGTNRKNQTFDEIFWALII
jgi:hypothetical protein